MLIDFVVYLPFLTDLNIMLMAIALTAIAAAENTEGFNIPFSVFIPIRKVFIKSKDKFLFESNIIMFLFVLMI